MNSCWSLSLFALLSVSACIPAPLDGSGKLVKENREVAAFTEVAIANRLTGTVSIGATSVSLNLDDNLVDMVHTTVSSGALDVASDGGEIQPSEGALVYIVAPTVDAITVAGRSNVTGEANGEDVRFEASGDSHLTVHATSASATLTSNGSSSVKLSGDAQKLSIEASGAAVIECDTASEEVDIEASGGSTVTVRASSHVSVHASGASSVTVTGSPTERDINSEGGATVTVQ